jgi:hypothetical protein
MARMIIGVCGARTASVVDDEFIADDDASPIPHFKHNEPKDDCGRDQRHEAARGSSDAGLLHRLLEDVERAEPAFAHPRWSRCCEGLRVVVDDVDPFSRDTVSTWRSGLQFQESGAISRCFRFAPWGSRRPGEGESHEYLCMIKTLKIISREEYITGIRVPLQFIDPQ